MIRNLVFDMGGVILAWSPDTFMEREGLRGEDKRIINENIFRSVEWLQMDRGIISPETAISTMLSRLPERLRAVGKKLCWGWADDLILIPGMEELIAELKNLHYPIYLLSNASKLQHEYWPKAPASRLFDATFISCDCQLVKPMPEIYRAFTDHFRLEPSECLFVDDTPANVEAAIYCGWQGIVFHGDTNQLRERMKTLNIL